MTPAPLSQIIIGSATWSYAFTTLRVLIYLLVGIVLLGVSFRGANYLGALLALILSIIAFASMGIIAASVIMVIKRGDPVTSLIGSVSTLVGGVLYPVEILPGWLQAIARLLPLTYALRSMRLALLSGASWQELLPDLLVLLFFCIVLFPLSLYAFRQAVRRVRIEGTLTHY